MAVSDYFNERGRLASDVLYGTSNSSSVIDSTDAEYQRLVAEFVYNGMYSRDALTQKTRELLAVACLTAMYRPDVLRIHIAASLRLASVDEVREAILQAGVYGGFPAVVSGLRLLAEVLAEQPVGERS